MATICKQGAAILPNRRLYKGSQNSGITKRYIIAGAERFLFPFPCTWYSDIGPGGLELRKSHSLSIRKLFVSHYGDVIMGTIASQISSHTIVYSTVYSDADQRKHQSSASLAFVWGIYRGPVNSQMASNAKNVSIWWRHHVSPIRRFMAPSRKVPKPRNWCQSCLVAMK